MYENENAIKRDMERAKRMRYYDKINEKNPDGTSRIFDVSPLTYQELVYKDTHILLEVYSVKSLTEFEDGTTVYSKNHRKYGTRSLFYNPRLNWCHYNNLLPEEDRLQDHDCDYMFDNEFAEYMKKRKLATNTALNGLYGEKLYEQHPKALSIMDKIIEYIPYYIRTDNIKEMYGVSTYLIENELTHKKSVW